MDKLLILEQRVIRGERFIYAKDETSGFYGWYRLELVETPTEETEGTVGA
jgi:hypothetical protein